MAADHSEPSREPLLVASQIMARSDDSKIISVEAIDMPYGSQTSIGTSRFVDLRENATEQGQKFAQDSGVDESKVNVVIASNFKASTVILKVARKRNVSMIVMGSTGKGAVVATI